MVVDVAREFLAGHPQSEGDEEGGQGGAGGYSQTQHGEESQQRRQENVTLVPDQRLQPLAELEDGK